MIVGFDNDDDDRLRPPVRVPPASRGSSARWPGMLSAIPKTPLYDRLEAEGRLDNAAADDPNIATNVIPLHMTVEEMRDGWLDLMDRLYDAENYFERFDDLFIEGRLPLATAKMRLAPQAPARCSYLKIQSLTILAALCACSPASGPTRGPARTARSTRKYLRKLLAAGRPPRYLFQFAWKCIMHTHFAIMTRQMVRGESRLVNT